MTMREPPIITTDKWNAKPPRQPITLAGKPTRIIFHHTAGHHPEIANPRDESLAEAIRYAQDIQQFHMHTNGWIDSGHNFLVCRNGVILVGRHQSYTQVKRGQMVVSAHCPGQNEQPGIEHEHAGTEPMTHAQREATAWLQAWIMVCTGIKPGMVFPHDHFSATSCPGSLLAEIPRVKKRTAEILSRGGP